MLPLSSYSTHSVAPALRHTHAAGIMPQHLEDVVQKKQEDPQAGVKVRVSIEV